MALAAPRATVRLLKAFSGRTLAHFPTLLAQITASDDQLWPLVEKSVACSC